MPSNIKKFLFLWCAVAFSLAALAGESIRIYGRDEVPAPDDIAGMLQAQKRSLHARPAVARTRGISLDPGAEAAAEPASDKQAEPAGAFALQINFDLDSAEVNQDFVPHVAAIAKGIELAGADLKVVIEGHTDARGAPQYNDALSLRRAMSVRRLLVEKYGVRAERLVAVGSGQRVLADAADPYSGRNRRVQFRVAE
jgi:outer membrane protein OmpA-like peptidoglycan-associated protein